MGVEGTSSVDADHGLDVLPGGIGTLITTRATFSFVLVRRGVVLLLVRGALAPLLELSGQHSTRSPSALKIFIVKFSLPSYLNRRRSLLLNLRPRSKTFHPCVRSKSLLVTKRVSTHTTP